MIRNVLALTLMMLIAFSLKAQEANVASRSVFVEVGGPSLVYTFNYDFRFDKDKLNSWGLRVGAGGYKLSDESLITIPIQATRLFGKGNHYFEVGGGFTLINYRGTSYSYGYYDPNTGEYIQTETEVKNKDWNFILDVNDTPGLMGTLNFGYRRIPVDGGFTFRANLTPIFNNHGFWPLFAGIGLGYAF